MVTEGSYALKSELLRSRCRREARYDRTADPCRARTTADRAACVLGLIVSGVAAFRHLPIDAFPDVTPVQVQVITRAPRWLLQKSNAS